MKLGYPRHGFRVTVRHQGVVLSQRVVWGPPWRALLELAVGAIAVTALLSWLSRAGVTLFGFLGPDLALLLIVVLAPTGAILALLALLWPRRLSLGADDIAAVPTPQDGELATLWWRPGRPPLLVAHVEGDAELELSPESHWRWSHGPAEVLVQAQGREDARRLPTDPLGDLGLVVVALAMYVGLVQARMLLAQLMPVGAAAAQDYGYDMSPELIARLLQKDLDGAEEGIQPRADRPDMEDEADGPYLPAGNRGLFDHSGGGAVQGDRVLRVDPTEEELEPEPAPLEPDPEPGEDLLDLVPLPEVPAAEELPGLEAPPPAAEALPIEEELNTGHLGEAMERFVGWGFRDWMEASPKARELDPQTRRTLELARQRLRLDPDDFGALQVVGHYAYLAEDVELCRNAFQRVVELYPDETAGYNNLALTYKRTGDFATEEGLYRQALALDPLDPVVLNNLAVNLAHQGRFDEAQELMSLLEELDPEDPYSELHRAKVYAAMGKRQRVYHHLELALEGISRLDSLHHVEFRQDLRLEPLFARYRGEERFRRLLERTYGADALTILQGSETGASRGGGDG